MCYEVEEKRDTQGPALARLRPRVRLTARPAGSRPSCLLAGVASGRGYRDLNWACNLRSKLGLGSDRGVGGSHRHMCSMCVRGVCVCTVRVVVNHMVKGLESHV